MSNTEFVQSSNSFIEFCNCLSQRYSSGHVRKLILVSYFLIFWLTAHSQNQELRFSYINTSTGLSNDIINCILQDNEDYLWIGTMEGLNRYDGYNNRIFKKELGVSSSIADNMIYDIYLDYQNRIWVGTQFGLSLYNPDKENFSNYILDSVRINVNTANRVTGIEENSANDLFVAVELGSLFTYDRQLGIFQKDHNDFKSIKDMIIDKEDKFWLGGVYGLYCYEKKTGYLKQFYFTNNSGNTYPITDVNTILEEGDTIWAGTIKGKLYYILKSTMQVKLLSQNFEETYYINDIFKGNDDLFYISTTNGLFVYNKFEKSYVAYKRQKDDPYGLNGVGVTKTYQDIQGNFWVGAFQGGVNLAVHGKSFKNYNNFSKEITLDIININCMLEDSKGYLWLGSFDQGINVIDPKKNQRKLYLNNPSDPGSIAYGSVYTIAEDSKGNIWVGNYLGYLQRFDKLTGKFVSYPFNPELGSDSKGHDIRSIVEDREGNLWMLAHGHGLSKFDPKTKKFKHFISDYSYRNTTLPDNWAFQIAADKNGIFWIATPSGLSRFDPQKESFTNYFHNGKDSSSLCHNFINVIFEDTNENLWIGTKYGLDLFDRKNNRFIHFYEKDGLPSNQIKGILEHKPGELWISTGNGLSRMRYYKNDPSEEIKAEFRNFNRSDNLQDIFFWDRSAMKLRNGLLVFGSEKGIIAFNPEEIKDNTRLPNVYIDAFKLFNKEVNIGDYDSTLVKSINLTDEIILRYNQNFFSFGFVAINYISNENNQYKYMMEGFDKGWVYAGNKREATYTNLNPGKYIFRVEASNNDGYWNNVGDSIKLTILPPYWQTWWFRITLFLAVIGISLLIYSYRIRNLKLSNIELEERVKRRTEELQDLNVKISKQNRLLEEQKNNIESAFGELARYRTKLEELVEERTKELISAKDRAEESDRLKSSFLANLSHEIRTPLNSIIGFSNLLLDPEVNDEERRSFKSIIEGSNNTLLNLINDIIDFSKIESGHLDISISDVSIGSVFNDISSIFNLEINKQRADKINTIEFRVNISEKTKSITVATDEIRLKQVLTNLINNAIKFTEKGYIEVGCQPIAEKNMLEFYVKDTGIGIKKEFSEIIFERFRKVEDDSANLYRGAGLGLAISHQLVRMLGGTIWLESEYQKGSVFYFTIPLLVGKNIKAGKNNFNLTSKIPALKDSLILVAEDDFANYSYLEKLLMKTKATILHAQNGKQVIQLMQKNPGVRLVLMDIKMPEMNGIDAFHELQKMKITIPVIAQTAYAFSDERKKIKDAGFTDYISKPIDAQELFSIISKHLIAE